VSREGIESANNRYFNNSWKGEAHALDDSLIIWRTKEIRPAKNVRACLPTLGLLLLIIRTHAQSAMQGVSLFHQFLDNFRIRGCHNLM
jgi:hypothetical protein